MSQSNEPASVVHLVTELDMGGAQQALYQLLRHMDRSRYAPMVVCLYNGDRVIADRIRELNIEVIDLGMSAKWRMDAVYRLYRLLRRQQPAILHTWMFHADVLGRVIGRLAQIPMIVTSRHSVEIGGYLRERIKRYTARLDHAVIAVCEKARQLEIERSGVAPEKVSTIYNGIAVDDFAPSLDPSFVPAAAGHRTPNLANSPIQRQPEIGHRRTPSLRHTLGIAPDALLLGLIARLQPPKGHTHLIDALALLVDEFPKIQLLLVGDGDLRPQLEAQVNALELSERVIFTGTRTDIPQLLQSMDIFVLPSLWEGMPTALLEAMAAGLPVVATASGGTTELVCDGENGLLVPPCDAQSLAGTLRVLLHSPELRRRLSTAGQAWVRAGFSIDHTVKSTEAIYAHLQASQSDPLNNRLHPKIS